MKKGSVFTAAAGSFLEGLKNIHNMHVTFFFYRAASYITGTEKGRSIPENIQLDIERIHR